MSDYTAPPTLALIIGLGMIWLAILLWVGDSRARKRKERTHKSETERHLGIIKGNALIVNPVTALEKHCDSGITGYASVHRHSVGFKDGHWETITAREYLLMRAAYEQGVEHTKKRRLA